MDRVLSEENMMIKTKKDYPASRGFSLVFLSVVLPFSLRFWLLAFCFGCEPAEEKTSADSRLRFLLNMREMKMRLPWNFLSRVGNTMPPPEFAHVFMSQISHGNDSHSPR